MKKNTAVIYLSLFIVFILIFSTSVNVILIVNLNKIEVLKNTVKRQAKKISFLETEIVKQNKIIKVAFNSAVQFEMLVGVKDPDGIVTYREKLLVTAKQMNRIKNFKN